MVTKLDRLIDDWLAQFPATTSRAYRTDLNQFAEWLDRPLLKAERRDVQAWIAEITDDYRPATVRRKVSAVSSFYTYALQAEKIKLNPAAHTRRPKGGNAQRLGLTQDETRRLLEHARQHSRFAHTLIAVLAVTGLRITEALTATVESIGTDAGKHTLAVHRKGGRDERIALTPGLLQLITDITDGATTGPILPGPRGGHVPAWRARQIIHDTADRADIDDVHPHRLRHTAATLAIRNGAPLERVQWMLGHQSPETTQRYIQSLRGLDESPSYDIDRQLLGGDVPGGSSKDQ